MAEPSSSFDPRNFISSDPTFNIANATYHDEQLSWNEGRNVIKTEDIITVTRGEEGYMVWSLVTSTEPDPKQLPPKLRATPATTLPQSFQDNHLFKALPAHLDSLQTDVHILISTLSGTGLSPSFYDSILHPILSAVGLKDADYNVVHTGSEDSIKDFVRSVLSVQADQGKKQTVLLLSGDGGIVDAINVLLEGGARSSEYIRPTFSQFPLGTGNALFHSLHRSSSIPSIYIQALRTLLHGTPQPLPIFQATFSQGARYLSEEGQKATPLVNNTLYGAVVASYGLHSTLVADSDTTEYRKHGDKRFGLVANDLLSPPEGSPHAYQADVTLFKGDARVKIDRESHGYILATLVSNLEKAFTISPASKPLDGQLRLIHFAAISGEETMDIMKQAYDSGNHISSKNVGYESVAGLRIQFREEGESWKWRRCCIDGLIVGIEKGGWMEVRTVESGHEAVNVVFD